MIIAVLGKIASGKSEVVRILQNYGFLCIYADKITRDLYKKGAAGQKKVAKYFGKDFLMEDFSVDRIKLRDVVFSSPKKLKLLNKIIHPLVYKEIMFRLSKLPKKVNVVLELTYLDDKKLIAMMDKIFWVERPSNLIEKALIHERGFTKILAKRVIKLGIRPKRVDFVIKNDSDFSALNFLVTQALGL